MTPNGLNISHRRDISDGECSIQRTPNVIWFGEVCSTEEPDTLSKSAKNDDDDDDVGVSESVVEVTSNPPPSTSTSLLTVSRSDEPVNRRRGSETTPSASRRPSSSSTLSDRCQPGRHNPQTHEKRQDWKALRMLSAILLAFIVTWTPYNLFTVIQAFCATCINPSLYSAGKSFHFPIIVCFYIQSMHAFNIAQYATETEVIRRKATSLVCIKVIRGQR